MKQHAIRNIWTLWS